MKGLSVGRMSGEIHLTAKEKLLVVSVVLAGITLAVYWQTSQFGFIRLDDPVYVVKNHRIQSGITLENIQWAFTTTYAEFWHPVTWLSLMLDYRLFGLQASAYHMNNLILHILSALLLLRLFYRMTGAIGKSAFIAAFFALHPIHVESVAWIAERKDVLSTFFGMFALCYYVDYAQNPNVKKYAVVFLFFILALMSKSSMLILPLIMILLDYWPLKRFEFQRPYSNLLVWQIREKAFLFLLSAVFSLITISVQPSVSHFPPGLRMANAIVSFVVYLQKTFFPVDLAVFYPFPSFVPASKIIGASILIAAVTILAVKSARRLPFLFVGWSWYGLSILPFLGIVQVGNHAMADRYMYFPLIGVGIALAWTIPCFFRSTSAGGKKLIALSAIFLALLAVLTWHDCGYWRGDKELFGHALKVAKDNYLAHICLGGVLEDEGRMQEAIDHCSEAIRLKPFYANSYNCRGSIYFRMGQYEKALQDCRQAIKVQPHYAESYYYEGLTFDRLKKYHQAVASLTQAIALQPHRADFYNARGNAYFSLKESQAAFEDYERAIRLKPDYGEAFMNRAIIFFNRGNKAAGCADMYRACALGVCRGWQWAQEKGFCRSRSLLKDSGRQRPPMP